MNYSVKSNVPNNLLGLAVSEGANEVALKFYMEEDVVSVGVWVYVAMSDGTMHLASAGDREDRFTEIALDRIQKNQKEKKDAQKQ